MEAKKKMAWLCLLMACSVVFSIPVSFATSADYQLDGFTITVADSWQVEGDGSGGMLRWSFMDTDGTPGICIMTVTNATGVVASEAALEKIAFSLGAGSYTMEKVGERDVLLCDLTQGDSYMAGAVFIEEGKSVVIMTRLSGPVNAIRQQDVAVGVVAGIRYNPEDGAAEKELRQPTSDGQGNIRYPIAGLTLTVPSDWVVLNEGVEGQLHLQFSDGGAVGLCVMVPRAVGTVEEGEKTKAVLREMADSLGTLTQELITVGGRDVLLCEVLQSGQMVSMALLMEGNQMAVLSVCLVDTGNVSRQRVILQSLANTVKSATE